MRLRLPLKPGTLFALLIFVSLKVWASEPAGGEHGLDSVVLLEIAVVWVVAKTFGEVFERLGQPSVLGELLGGIVLGNLALFGVTSLEHLKTDAVIGALASIGVIILLFEVGLESTVREMLDVGSTALLVAIVGVFLPFLLGWGLAAYFLPDGSRLAHLFIGATLCATSVGITARVLKDLGRIATRESRIILGAAVIDDILGLLILAVVSGAIEAVSRGTEIAPFDFVWIAVKAVLFLALATIAGRYVAVPFFRWASRFKSNGALLTISLAFCFLFAWAASKVALAPIVGAFAAGLLLDEVHFRPFTARGEKDIEELIEPVSLVLVPIFFVLMGIKVDLRELVHLNILGFALALTVGAIIGKQACSLVVWGGKLDRLTIGLGMIPRGEVGLIFAGIGATLTLPGPNGSTVPVIDSSTFSAVVIMVILTTLATPPLLKWSLGRNRAINETEKQ